MTLRERLGFSTAVFGQNLVYNWFALFLLVYLYEGLALSNRAIVTLTIILTVVRVWDAVNDVVVGLLIDRTRTSWGTFRPYVIGSALPVAALTWALFSIPDTSERAQLALIAVAYVLWDIAYTVCDVPLWSLTAVITTDEAHRARLVGWARAASVVALAIITLAGAPLAIALSGGDEATASGWGWAALLVSVLGMALYTLAFFATREKVPHRPEPMAFGRSLRQLAGNRPLLLVLLSGVLAFGPMLLQVGGAVLATVVFGGVEVFTTLGGALIAGIAVGALITPRVLRALARRSAMLAALLGLAGANLVMLLTGYGSQWVVAGLFFVQGVFNGVFMVTQTLLIADTADLAEVRTGDRVDGVSFAGMTFVTKLATAVATLVFGLAVGTAGYEKSVVVTEAMRDQLWLWMTGVGAASALLAMLPLRWYRVPEDELPELLAERRARRAAAGEPIADDLTEA